MINKSVRSALIAIVMSTLFSNISLAGTNQKGDADITGLKKHYKVLNLSKEQRSSLKSLNKDNHAAYKKVKNAIKRLKVQKKELSDNNGDKAAIKALSKKIKVKSKVIKALTKSIHKKALAVLNKKQNAKLSKIKKKRKDSVAKSRAKNKAKKIARAKRKAKEERKSK